MSTEKTIGVVAPARKMNPEDIAAGINRITEWGYHIKKGKHLYGSHFQFSGTDEERIADLQSMINDNEVDHIVFARGGYGCLRIVDHIDFSPIKNSGKLLAGYSDITVFHNHLISLHQIPSLHCTMPVNMNQNSALSLQSLKDALEGKDLSYSTEACSLNRSGKSEGILFGGNLSLIYAMNGSRSLPDPRGKILFLEDLDEYLYHIDRMMLNLKRCGMLSGISGLVVGGFTGMKDNPIAYGKTAEEIIREHVEEYDYPVCFGFPAGHIEDNRCLIMGGKLRMEVTASGAEVTSYQN
jgi:muramoyltetrapeptide carboxypeptidase